jgi:AcrR family transcriptional regulator
LAADPDGEPTRRERMRAATMREITATARRLLVEQGPDATSLRAIAREMGMTAPGLYRYYTSRDDLLRHVIGEIFLELASDIRGAINAADAAGDCTGDKRAALTVKLVAACREFRRWSLTNRKEFSLVFGVPMPGLHYKGVNDIAEQCAMEFAGTFYALFVELWTVLPFPVPSDADIDPVLAPQLGQYRAKLHTDAPLGAILVFLRCWVLLYGALAMEIFGHLDFALDDSAPMFEITLSELAAKIGLEYLPPGR